MLERNYKFFAPEGVDGGAPADPGPQSTVPVADPAPSPVADPALSGEDTIAGGDPAAPKNPPWYHKRIDELTGHYRGEQRLHAQTRARADLLEAENAVLRGRQAAPAPAAQPGAAPAPAAAPAAPQQRGTPLPTREQLMEVVQTEAARLAHENEFARECNNMVATGKEKYPDFQVSLESFKQLGGIPPDLVAEALETGQGHEILYTLSKDLDETSRIMSLSPGRRAVALDRMAQSLADAGNPVTRQSRAPSPPPGIKPGARTPDRLDNPSTDMDSWVKLREKQLANG